MFVSRSKGKLPLRSIHMKDVKVVKYHIQVATLFLVLHDTGFLYTISFTDRRIIKRLKILQKALRVLIGNH